jgi:hypothetical protein
VNRRLDERIRRAVAMPANVMQEKLWSHVNRLALTDQVVTVPLQVDGLTSPSDPRPFAPAQRTLVNPPRTVGEYAAFPSNHQGLDTLLGNLPSGESWLLQPTDRAEAQALRQKAVSNLHNQDGAAIR